MAVECDVRIREIVDEEEVVLPREIDQALHVLGRGDSRCRVVWERHDHDARRVRPALLRRCRRGIPVSPRAREITVAPASTGATRWIG